jgi:gamma-glutamylcyclotransferase (GGCT)/AIG2-like uncharacterized protein YtfP
VPLCFAYGSNMDRAAMLTRCPGAKAIGLARLPRHTRAVMREGYLTLLRDPAREVTGVLWDVPSADMAALDRYEGVGARLYRKVQQIVIGPAGARRALVYFGANTGPGVLRRDYCAQILAAAMANGLPRADSAMIEALSSFTHK